MKTVRHSLTALFALLALSAAAPAEATDPIVTPGYIATGFVIGAGQGLKHGTLRIAGNFREGPTVLDLRQHGATATITSLLEEWDDPTLDGEGGEMIVDLPLTLVNRLSNTEYVYFETPPGTVSPATGLPIFARIYVNTCVADPCKPGRAVGRWNYQIDVVSATVDAPAECTSAHRTKMTTSFTIQDGINPPLEVTTTEKTWKCRDSDRVLVTP